MSVPRNELDFALRLVWQLEWLADRIGAETVDNEALQSQRRAAVVLFNELDDQDALPETRRLLRDGGAGANAHDILGWYQPGLVVPPRQERLAAVDNALASLRAPVAQALEALPTEEQSQLEERRERFFSALSEVRLP